MKAGRDIHTLANEIQSVAALRQDFVAPSDKIRMTSKMELETQNGDLNKIFGLTDIAHQGIARRLDIPKPYYDRMRTEQPHLLADNVNTWLRDGDQRHMLRTLDSFDQLTPPICRAVLSERYRIIDNDFVMNGLMPILMEEPGMIIESAEITDTKFYLKCRFPSLEREIKLGDAVQSGVIITNSEVGFGATTASFLIYTLRCTNGMILPSTAFSKRKNHIGRVQEHDENFQIIASDETRELEDKAFLSTLKDVIKAAGDPDVFADVADKILDSTDRKITGNVERTIENVTRKMDLLKSEGESVLEFLTRGHDLTQWGVASAVTRMAQDAASYDRSTELERIGGKIIELSASEFERLAA